MQIKLEQIANKQCLLYYKLLNLEGNNWQKILECSLVNQNLIHNYVKCSFNPEGMGYCSHMQDHNSYKAVNYKG